MDCLTFRRKLLEDPMRQEAALLAHEDDCASCAEFARHTRAQEARLRAMLNQVSPPPELADRIQLAASFETRNLRPTRRWLAVAASILLVAATVAIGLFVSPLERQAMSMADSVLDHMHDEIHHLHEVQSVKSAQLSQLFGRFGGVVTGDIGPINFAAECLMRKKNGVHLVVPGKFGPITVFFMPHERATESTRLSDASFAGQIIPTRWGSLAVIGLKNEPLEGIADQMMRAVSWSAPVQVSRLGRPKPPQA